MSNEKSQVDIILEQYERNNKPKYEKRENPKVYDLKNYFNTILKDGVDKATKRIRILPSNENGKSPFVQVYGHKIQVDGSWKTFACLKHEKEEACPFCDARQVLLETGDASDKELAKKYNARLMYVVKVIDRDAEEDGVKFWRFNHDFRKEGIFDKIQGILMALKKDITNVETGRDLSISINRNASKAPVVSSIVSLDPSPLSTDKEKIEKWLSNKNTWEDVYSIKPYEYLEILVKGGTPGWDNDLKKYVDKTKNDSPDKTEGEITIGVDNVKTDIKVSTGPASSQEDEDQLPF